MKPVNRRNNKRNRAVETPHGIFATVLRNANLSIRSGDFESALNSLDSLAAKENDPASKGKILLLTAESTMRLGRYGESVEIYRKSRNFFRAASHPSWFSAALGEIECTLKAQQTEDACTKAQAVVELMHEDVAALKQIEDSPAHHFTAPGGVFVGPRPERPTTILTRLGNLFLREGYPEFALDFFQKAINMSPNGASRSRQGMAEIALAKGDLESTERYARESLQMGRFQAKTIHSWSLYHQARSRLGKCPHDSELHAGMLQSADKSVTDRATIAIVESLRKLSDRSWKEIATACVMEQTDYDAIYKLELSKILLADARIVEPDPAAIATAAANLLSNSLISTIEIVALIKTYALYSLMADLDEKAVLNTISKVAKKLSPAGAARVVHSAALGAMLAARHDFARVLLEDQIAALQPGSVQWGRDLWALARMESVVGNYEKAALHYLQCADHGDTPERFQLQGLLRWLFQIEKSGVQPDIAGTTVKLKRILARIADYGVMLDAARQLALAGEPFKALKDVAADAAVTAARGAFEEAKDPTEALAILIHLARRQYYDLFSGDSIFKYWDSLPTAKREWVWSRDGRFWEYMCLVMMAYENSSMSEAADRLANELLVRITTPPHGFVQVATTYGEMLIRRGDVRSGLVQMEKAVPVAPASTYTARAYYWRAIVARNKGNSADVVTNANLIRRCFGTFPGLFWEKSLDARATVLLGGAVGKKENPAQERRYTDGYLAAQASAIEEDATLLREQ
jgi:tetratricopeptide (TPR) repeat protein